MPVLFDSRSHRRLTGIPATNQAESILTPARTFAGSPRSMVWSPDVRRVVYEPNEVPVGAQAATEAASGGRALVSIAADGSGVREPASPDQHFHPFGFFPDGDLLAAHLHDNAQQIDIVRTHLVEVRARVVLPSRSAHVVRRHTQSGFNFKPATLLFESRIVRSQQPPSYDVSADGRFIITRSAETAPNPITVVLNWTSALALRYDLLL